MMRRLFLPSTKQINKYGAYFIEGRDSWTKLYQNRAIICSMILDVN